MGGSLIKNTGGTLSLNAANTYSGSTAVTAGTLALGNVAALGGTSSLLMTGGTTLTPTVTGIVVNAPITVGLVNTTVRINAPNTGNQDFTTNVLTLGGVIGGAGNVTFNGPTNSNQSYNVLLTAQSNYTGSTLMDTSGGTASQITVRLGIHLWRPGLCSPTEYC